MQPSTTLFTLPLLLLHLTLASPAPPLYLPSHFGSLAPPAPTTTNPLSCPPGPKGDSAYYTTLCSTTYNYSCANNQLTLTIDYPAPNGGRGRSDPDDVCPHCSCVGQGSPSVTASVTASATLTTTSSAPAISVVSAWYYGVGLGGGEGMGQQRWGGG